MISVSNHQIDQSPSIYTPPPPESRLPDPESRISRSPSPESRHSSGHGFAAGDMVWGKVKSHPWWPGLIFNEAFASPSVRRSRRDNHVLVAFFGDSSYGWFDPHELVHYAPNFLEKSKQTAARSFMKAVEESVDEASRRAALGLTCMCRNKFNFRPTKVPGYFAVDVPGYERGGIYSREHIEQAREEFVPKEGLSFLKGLAVAPTGAGPRDLEWTKKMAQFMALRKATYEEFDDTYAEAFGMKAVRPPPDDLENEPEKFAPRVAPLSGPLVIAEALGAKKNNKKKQSVQKPSSKKKDKYLIKRRDEVTNPLLIEPFIVPSPSPPPADIDSYVLQKRDDPPTPPYNSIPQPEVPILPPVDAPPPLVADHKEPKKTKKHARTDVGIDGVDPPKKKKQKKVKTKEEQGSMAVKLKKLALGKDVTTPPPPSPPKPELSEIEVPQLLEDLSGLAMDPFHGADHNAAALVSEFFLKFRSLVYQKSLVLPSPSEAAEDHQVVDIPPRKKKQPQQQQPPVVVAPPKERKEKTEKPPKVKLGRLFKRSSDPTNSGRKRPASDKPTTTETPLKRAKPEKPTAPPRSANPVPKKFSPTNLIMKFPPRATLPSIANLKARFARFGPLDVDMCRVIWNTHTCRVYFKYKSDALEAYNFVKANNLFGLINVRYFLKEVEMEGLPPPPPPPQQQTEPTKPLKSILKKPGEDAAKETLRVKFKLDNEAPVMPPRSMNANEAYLRQQVREYGGAATAAGAAAGGSSGGGNAEEEVDVSHKMLSLMLRCSDVVARLKATPGFVMYRPL